MAPTTKARSREWSIILILLSLSTIDIIIYHIIIFTQGLMEKTPISKMTLEAANKGK
jgi:hypothetical protein